MARGRGRESAEERKTSLLKGLVEVRARILAEACAVEERLRDEVFLGVWSLVDLLAHLAGWDVTNREAVQSIGRGELPEFYAYRDRGWASYNAKLVAEYRRADFKELITLLEHTHQDLIESLEKIPAEEFDRDRGVRARGYIVLISRLMQTELNDEKKHLKQIERFVAGQ